MLKVYSYTEYNIKIFLIGGKGTYSNANIPVNLPFKNDILSSPYQTGPKKQFLQLNSQISGDNLIRIEVDKDATSSNNSSMISGIGGLDKWGRKDISEAEEQAKKMREEIKEERKKDTVKDAIKEYYFTINTFNC